MNFTSKLTLAFAATVTLVFPIVADAEPHPSATAAAVSIKFNDCSNCGSATGNVTISPAGVTTASGTGVKELSAAVATGETSATANSASHREGTTATANGFSQPVTFKHVTINDASDSINNRDYSYTYPTNNSQGAANYNVSDKTSNSLNTTRGTTSYEYTGSSAGLLYIPVIK